MRHVVSMQRVCDGKMALLQEWGWTVAKVKLLDLQQMLSQEVLLCVILSRDKSVSSVG